MATTIGQASFVFLQAPRQTILDNSMRMHEVWIFLIL
jgi:hypothetical protein